MHPERDWRRRIARARALYKQYSEDHEVAYVGTAKYTSGSRMALAVADNQAKLLTSSSIITNSTTEAAIALVLICTSATKIITDSTSAILNYANGYIYAAPLLTYYASGSPGAP